MQIFLAALIAGGIPLIFLFVIYALDLYASRTFRLVLACFAWGAIGGVGLAYLFNTHVSVPFIQRHHLDMLLLYVLFAPIAEEVFKSLVLFPVSRHRDFTYFVDGAIYGFASGIGFSIVENFLYISETSRAAILLALIRAFSTCLMHGAAAALVGVAIGRFRFQRGVHRGMAIAGGWFAAIALHAFFNALGQANLVSLGLVTPLSVAIGLLGVGLITFFINRGLREEGQWMLETLDRQVAVSGAEARAAQSFASLDELLTPLAATFPEKAAQIEALVLHQAKFGIKRKIFQQLDSPEARARLQQELDDMQAEMERLRRQIGSYAMIYVRSVFPEGRVNVWSNLELLVRNDQPADVARWADLLTAKTPPEGGAPPTRSIFGRLGELQQEKRQEQGASQENP
ncbi:MAG: hypothetical protein BWY25_02690 [Chloroflexi bacterium ADurb.Bin222]|nr:MAG: hypothetical protein BWY25_02690 [Chloroflexi bacterium ADurb.Bin222]